MNIQSDLDIVGAPVERLRLCRACDAFPLELKGGEIEVVRGEVQVFHVLSAQALLGQQSPRLPSRQHTQTDHGTRGFGTLEEQG